MSDASSLRTIGLLTPHLSGVFCGGIIVAAQGEAQRRGIRLIVIQGSPRDIVSSRLAWKRVDGWIASVDIDGVELIAEAGVPVVTISNLTTNISAVLPDNYGGMLAAVSHLIAHGHRTIAFLGRLRNMDVAQRLAGYKAALARHAIPFDEQLVIDADNELEHGGACAAATMLAAGLIPTALAASTDKNAVGALQVLREAGYRVPEDMAIISFDDVTQAQTADPPLTTVRQHIPVLAHCAIDRLLMQIADPSIEHCTTYVPTALVVRRSCGCDQVPGLALNDHYGIAEETGITNLDQKLLQMFSAPALSSPDSQPAWPGIEILTMTVRAAIEGDALPDSAQILAAWRSAITLTSDLDTLDTACHLLEQTGARLLHSRPRDDGATTRLAYALRLIRSELLRARVGHENEQVRQIDAILTTSHAIGTDILNNMTSSAPTLDWLCHTTANWGYLGLWTDPSQPAELALASVYPSIGQQHFLLGERVTPDMFPPAAWLQCSGFPEPTMMTLRLLRTARRAWGVLAIDGILNTSVTWNSDPIVIWARMFEVALDHAAVLAELNHSALYDTLTDLPNRTLFVDRLRQAMGRACQSASYCCAVLFLDLDGFKIINDSLGHYIGDQLLIGVAERLRSVLRSDDIAARFGGDEFAMLIQGAQEIDQLLRVAERIQQCLAQPFQLNGHAIVITASIGMMTNLSSYTSADDVLRDADIAMYRAKASGKRTYAIFTAGMHTGAMNRLRIETELRRAIAAQELVLEYQPIVRLETGKTVGWEALIRWEHPEHGLLQPATFLPVAEESGLIVLLGQWVFLEACRQIRQWVACAPDWGDRYISVNVSQKQFWHPCLVEQIARALQETGVDARCLQIEITEGVVMNNSDMAYKILEQLRDLGLTLAIDDFGTGYSSLDVLHQFPIHALKIDRAFVARLGHSPRSSEMVRTIIQMGCNLGLEVVAEGIETQAQRELLQQAQCTFGQGYLFARPLRAGAIMSA